MKRCYNCHGDICTRYGCDSSDLHITLAPRHQSSVFSLNIRLAYVRAILHVRCLSTLPPTYSYVHVCAQLCPTLCDSVACIRPGSSVHGILQARILERAAISSSFPSQPRDQTCFSCVSCTGNFFFFFFFFFKHWATSVSHSFAY